MYICIYVYMYICIYVYTSTFQVLGPRPPRTHTTSTATTRSARAYDMPTIFKDLVEFHLRNVESADIIWRLEIMLCSKLHVKQQVT